MSQPTTQSQTKRIKMRKLLALMIFQRSMKLLSTNNLPKTDQQSKVLQSVRPVQAKDLMPEPKEEGSDIISDV